MINIKQTKTAQSSQTSGSTAQTAAKHPLAKVIGKFEGEFWEATLAEVQRLRDQDREELETSF